MRVGARPLYKPRRPSSLVILQILSCQEYESEGEEGSLYSRAWVEEQGHGPFSRHGAWVEEQGHGPFSRHGAWVEEQGYGPFSRHDLTGLYSIRSTQ
jgi:hypothetical protein